MRNGQKGFFIGITLLLSLRGWTQPHLSERQIHYRPGDWISYLVSRYVTSITLGHQYVYYGTTGGIIRYNFYSHRWDTPFTISDGLEDDCIHLVLYDFNSGYLWCVTETGVHFRIPSSEQWMGISYENLGVPMISSIGRGTQFLWLEGEEQFLKGDPTSGDFWSATPKEMNQDNVDWHGARAHGTKASYPYFFMENGYLFFPEGYIQDVEQRRFEIQKSLQDDFFNLWLATWGLGTGVADMRTYALKLLPFGPYTPEIDAMAWDEEGMWMGGRHQGGESEGITWWDMTHQKWIYFEGLFIPQLRNDQITSIAVNTGTVWFGTMNGLARYDKQKNIWRVYSIHNNLWDNRITTVAFGERALWIGTEMGINKMQQPETIIEKEQDKRLIHKKIYHLEVDEEGIWAGTEQGIFYYNYKSGAWEYIPGYPGMVAHAITAISLWGNEVWFGTDDGVEVYQKSRKQWKGFPKTHFPTDGYIHTILADSTAVWIGTDNGVLKYNKEEDRWRRFTTEDGLANNAVHWILLEGDYIWFGTQRGLTRFYWNAPYRTD